MNELLTTALKQAYAKAQADATLFHTLELSHDNLSEPLYLVQGFLNRELSVSGVTKVFRAIPFQFTLPEHGDSGLQELSLSIDDVGREVSRFCRAAAQFPAPVVIKYRPYLSTDTTTPQMDPPLLMYLLNVEIKAGVVQGRAVTHDFLNMRFPAEKYTRERFPALGDL
jgi:hypothetical protein